MNTEIPEGVLERLVRIETKLDLANKDNDGRVKLEDERHTDHETRLRRVEKILWLLTPTAAAGGGIVGNLVGPWLGGN